MTDRYPLFKAQGTSIEKVIFVTFIEGDDQSGLPALGSQAIEAEGIVSSIKANGLESEAEVFLSSIEADQSVDAIVAITVSQGDQQGQLASVVETISG